jgi:Flp pilus assembly pilin Flp
MQMTLFYLAHIRLTNAIADLREREEGQGLTEYVILVGAVAAMVIILVGTLTTKLTTYINSILNALPTP